MEWAILSEELQSEIFQPIFEQKKLAVITSAVPYTVQVCLIITLLAIIFVRSIIELSWANKGMLHTGETDNDCESRILPEPVKERTWWFRDEIADV